jgi:hypothetical protein
MNVRFFPRQKAFRIQGMFPYFAKCKICASREVESVCKIPSLSLPLSLSLSLPLTLTLSHSLSLTLTFSLSHTHILSLSLHAWKYLLMRQRASSQIWLIEVNTNPYIGCSSQILREVKPQSPQLVPSCLKFCPLNLQLYIFL